MSSISERYRITWSLFSAFSQERPLFCDSFVLFPEKRVDLPVVFHAIHDGCVKNNITSSESLKNSTTNLTCDGKLGSGTRMHNMSIAGTGCNSNKAVWTLSWPPQSWTLEKPKRLGTLSTDVEAILNLKIPIYLADTSQRFHGWKPCGMNFRFYRPQLKLIWGPKWKTV